MNKKCRMLLAGLLLCQQACTTQPDLAPTERLDMRSAVNTTIMAEPWVYSREVPTLAANSRDYLNLGVVETNRAGLRGYWLGVVAWSTIDRSALRGPAVPVEPGTIELNWADGTMELVPDPAGRAAIGAGQPIFRGPQPEYEDAWYLLSMAQLARLAESPPDSVTVALPEGRSVVYTAWRVERGALDEFLAATGHPERTR
jgi:hypothetical protein